MRTSLDHLPPRRREQLAAIVELLRAEAPVEMVILFGSYARGDAVEDLPSGYFSDFDLLVVVADPAVAADDLLWARLGDRARALTGRVPVTLLVHDVKQLNKEIRTGRYFFSDILVEGIVLHDSRRLTLAHPKALNAAERLAIAERDFRYWFESATEFWRGAGYYAARGQRAHAAFLLHQSVERYFHAVLLVFTGYKPKTHDIAWLANETAPLHASLAGALPRSTPEDEHRFKLLKRAYIEARYSKSFAITDDELAVLRDHVRDLAARVREACAAKLGTINGPEAVGVLPEVPQAMDIGELPEAPPLGDPRAIERWREAIAATSEARGRAEGVREGEARGRQEGIEEGLRQGEHRGQRDGEARGQARAIVDVLRRRGVPMTTAEAEQILLCRDQALLARWWELAFAAMSVADLLEQPPPG